MAHQLVGRVSTRVDLDETRTYFRDLKVHFMILGTYKTRADNFKEQPSQKGVQILDGMIISIHNAWTQNQ